MPLFVDESVSGGPGLILPGLDGGCLMAETEMIRFWDNQIPPGAKLEQMRAYVAMLALHSRGWLDEHNRASRRVLRHAAWPVELKQLRRIYLRPGWYPPGILGGKLDESSTLLAAPGKRSLDGTRREHGSSGMEQKHLEVKELDPLVIQNTQTTVNRTFSNGDSVIESMVALVRGEMRMEDFPKVKVAQDPESFAWYAADNRRCFTFKVVAPLLKIKFVEVQVINWTDEFKSKLNQVPRFGDVWTTDNASVEAVRQEVQSLLDCKVNTREAQQLSDSVAMGEADYLDLQRRAGNIMAQVTQTEVGAQSATSLLPASVTRKRRLPNLRPHPRSDRLQAFDEEAGESSGTTTPRDSVREESLADPLRASSATPRSVDVGEAPSVLPQGLPPVTSSIRVEQSLGHLLAEPASRSLSSAARRSEPMSPPPPPRSPRVRELPARRPEEQDRVLRLVIQSLETLAGNAGNTDVQDPISVLNLAVMGHFKPHDGETMPLNYLPFEKTADGLFVVKVNVCGHVFQSEACRNSKLARKSAAREAVAGLVAMNSVRV